MTLPTSIIEKIESLCEGVSSKTLAKAYQGLSNRYRGLDAMKSASFINEDIERLAYLIARFPATYAVNDHLAASFHKMTQDSSVETILDLGCGSGASSIAWISRLPFIKKAILVEKDPHLISLGKTLFQDEVSSSIEVEWKLQDLLSFQALPKVDLVLMSYSLNEIKTSQQMELLEKIEQLQPKYIVLIEPGREMSYKRLMECREALFKKHYKIIAPCPHEKRCPLLGIDWCHFSKRLPRTSLHRWIKAGDLGYEDEKFSYVIVGKKEEVILYDRVIAPPEIHSGFVKLRLCKKAGNIQDITVSKKEGPLFKLAKKAYWGSTFDKEELQEDS